MGDPSLKTCPCLVINHEVTQRVHFGSVGWAWALALLGENKMEYNQNAVDAIAVFEARIEASRLDPTLALHIGGILSAIELQVEEGKGRRAVVTHLFAAISELIMACPEKKSVSLRDALLQCERALLENMGAGSGL
jgi:hypothetical protein